MIMFYLCVPLITFPHSRFFCILSDKRKEELVLMILEWNLGRWFVKRRTGRRSRRSKEEEERKSMGCSSVWIFLLSFSLSHQSVTAQAEGNSWHSYPHRKHSNTQFINLPLMFQLFIVLTTHVEPFSFHIYFYSITYSVINLFNISVCALWCHHLLNSESKPYVWFSAVCTDLWIRWLGCLGQRKGRCSMNTVCASAPSLNLHTWVGTRGRH